jgi:phospholipase C
LNKRFSVILAAGALLVGLVSGAGAASPVVPQTPQGDPAVKKCLVPAAKEPKLSRGQLIGLLRRQVKYVFVLYQENRSFDSYFGTFPCAEGIFSQPADKTPGFHQTIINPDGSSATIQPFRIGPAEYAADTDDVDHSHALIVQKMHVVKGAAKMDRFALVEETKYTAAGAKPSLKAKQMGELTMAYMDGDTIPFLWRYANRFVLFDHIFQTMTGPSTPGNLLIIAAQSGQTQAALHPGEVYQGNGNRGPGVPVLNDEDPFWGSPKDMTATGKKQPVNPKDFAGADPYGIQLNQTYATLLLSLAGKGARKQTFADRDPGGDLADVQRDVAFLTRHGQKPIPWGWYEEGYDKEPTDPNQGPTDANGLHASYITHHNGPQYFGYIANNPDLSRNLHGLKDFFKDVHKGKLPETEGLFFVKGGYQNIFGLKPADPDPTVQKNFLGDDDHPGYSDAQISEALVAKAVNAIARSKYWSNCAIILTWDDSEGDYDHEPPPIRSYGPDGSVITAGPRVPLLVISPYARTHHIAHNPGDHGSVVKFADVLFGLTPLAKLPDERKGRVLGKQRFGQSNWGPDDALTPGVCDLVAAFDPARLKGEAAPLPPSYAIIPDIIVEVLPQKSGFGLKDIGVTPVDIARHISNPVPADFNPRPKTNPSPGGK